MCRFDVNFFYSYQFNVVLHIAVLHFQSTQCYVLLIERHLDKTVKTIDKRNRFHSPSTYALCRESFSPLYCIHPVSSSCKSKVAQETCAKSMKQMRSASNDDTIRILLCRRNCSHWRRLGPRFGGKNFLPSPEM